MCPKGVQAPHGLAPGAVVPLVRPQVRRKVCGPWASRWGTWANPTPTASCSPTCKVGPPCPSCPAGLPWEESGKAHPAPGTPIRCGCSLCRELWRRPGTFQVLPSESGSECHQLVPFSLPGSSAKVTRDEQPRGRSSPCVLFFYPDEMCRDHVLASPSLHVEFWVPPAPQPRPPAGLPMTVPADGDFPFVSQSVPEDAAVRRVCAQLRGNWAVLEGEHAAHTGRARRHVLEGDAQ